MISYIHFEMPVACLCMSFICWKLERSTLASFLPSQPLVLVYLILYTSPKDGAEVVSYRGHESEAINAPVKEDSSLRGFDMTFTIGKGNEICCQAIASIVEEHLLGREVEPLFANMGETWQLMASDPQLRWIGPEKGVIHR